MLALSTGLEEIGLQAGDVLVAEGDRPASVWVLVSGRLAVSRSGQQFNTVEQPGALIGEVSQLLGVAATGHGHCD